MVETLPLTFAEVTSRDSGPSLLLAGHSQGQVTLPQSRTSVLKEPAWVRLVAPLPGSQGSRGGHPSPPQPERTPFLGLTPPSPAELTWLQTQVLCWPHWVTAPRALDPPLRAEGSGLRGEPQGEGALVSRGYPVGYSSCPRISPVLEFSRSYLQMLCSSGKHLGFLFSPAGTSAQQTRAGVGVGWGLRRTSGEWGRGLELWGQHPWPRCLHLPQTHSDEMELMSNRSSGLGRSSETGARFCSHLPAPVTEATVGTLLGSWSLTQRHVCAL